MSTLSVKSMLGPIFSNLILIEISLMKTVKK